MKRPNRSCTNHCVSPAVGSGIGITRSFSEKVLCNCSRSWQESLRSTSESESMQAPKGYVCYRTTGPLSLNGKLDDPSWKAAPWTDLFGDIEGDLKPKPRFQTRAKMLWDDNYFYI